MFEQTETFVLHSVEWLRLIVETFGALVIATGIAAATSGLVRHWRVRPRTGFSAARVSSARYLALEYQLAADILSTAVAPSWKRIGKLGAIAVIRTGLHYFLTREMREKSRASAASSPR